MELKPVLALLKDSAGLVLLVRRKGSLLWSLPGGLLRDGVSAADMLSIYCQRQIGSGPDFNAPFLHFRFANRAIMVGCDVIPHQRAGARGRIEASGWFRSDALPVGTEPVARLAVALHHVASTPDAEEQSIALAVA